MKRPNIFQRTALRLLGFGYGDAGASHKRRAFKKYTSKSKSPLSDIDKNNDTLRSRARSLYMGGSSLATSAIKSLRTSVVGPGLYLHAQVDKKYLGLSDEEAVALNSEIEAEFELWASDKKAASTTGLHDFYELQQLALMSWRLSGDVFALFEYDPTTWMRPYGLRVRLLEADRISTPFSSNVAPTLTYGTNRENGNKIFDGVEVDDRGRVVAYHICNVFPGEFVLEPVEWVRIETEGELTGLPNILHIMEAERPEQYRGVTCLAPVIENLLQLGRYINSEEAAALLESYFTIYVETENASGSGPSLGMAIPEWDKNNDEDDDENDDDGEKKGKRDPSDYLMGPAQVNFLKTGEKINAVDPKRPHSQFDPFTRAVATHVGAALDIPVDVLLKSYNTSYSAARASLQDYWRKTRIDRELFNGNFNDLVFEAFFCEAVARDRIHAPGFFTDPRAKQAYLRHEWNGPAMPHLDPEKEAKAAKIMVEQGFMTRTQATTQLNGGDYLANVEQLLRETELLEPILLMLSSAVAVKKEQENDSDEDKPNSEQT